MTKQAPQTGAWPGSAAHEAEHAAAVLLALELIEGAVAAEGAGVVDAGELDELELAEHGRDVARRVDPVRVEAHPRAADREGEQQLSAGRDHALELGCGLAGAERVERVAVAAEPDVL